MKVEGRKITVNKSAKDIFAFLKNMNNYEQLMPENIDKFSVHESGKGFKVGLKNMPQIAMKLDEEVENESLRFISPIPELSYDLDIVISNPQEEQSDVQIFFTGKFNKMIEMMAKKPITKFIKAITENAEVKIV